jgi:hypothetical protein
MPYRLSPGAQRRLQHFAKIAREFHVGPTGETTVVNERYRNPFTDPQITRDHIELLRSPERTRERDLRHAASLLKLDMIGQPSASLQPSAKSSRSPLLGLAGLAGLTGAAAGGHHLYKQHQREKLMKRLAMGGAALAGGGLLARHLMNRDDE